LFYSLFKTDIFSEKRRKALQNQQGWNCQNCQKWKLCQ